MRRASLPPARTAAALLRRASPLSPPLRLPRRRPRPPPPPPPSPLDLRHPHDAYPVARALRRTIHAHLGPTNSGKTHAALAALSSARTGVYLGPLRLLAHEVAARLGVPCDVRTGHGVTRADGARHAACTVEMACLATRVDVAVLDEVQLLAHPERGWAWTRALLGLPAAQLHVCGSDDALPLLRTLAAACGDALLLHPHARLAPLRVRRASLRSDLSRVRPGDCVVAFSRRELFALRRQIEARASLRCSLLYGALPPAAREAQARRFHAARARVLVASDAVGMGLNLAIGRVVFASLHRFDGAARVPLDAAAVRQIGGRAGRYASRYASGEVACLHAADVPLLRAAMGEAPPPLRAAGLAPSFEQLAALAAACARGTPFSRLLAAFADGARLDPLYFCCGLEAPQLLAELVDDLPPFLPAAPLTPQTPLDARDPLHAEAFVQWAGALAAGSTARIGGRPLLRPPVREEELHALESYYKVLDAYVWLSVRFAHAFTEEIAEEARREQRKCSKLISLGLDSLGARPARPVRKLLHARPHGTMKRRRRSSCS
ncbi:hypothetical protein AB1Y20_005911 [Prymnesium parvum]|uniref:Helicase C-terminal domain-containing protein n=1 Tax=Prymnesium parvum TaxID=97485 RepID=A0AB34J155_PRYPA